MGGGLMQLVAYGAQDIYLTGNPQITFFKVVYRRHTNFAMENIQQSFTGDATFGKRVTAIVSRNGDLINSAYLQITLPHLQDVGFKITSEENTGISISLSRLQQQCTLCWTNFIGLALVSEVTVEIGGQPIDKHFNTWMYIWQELTMTSEKAEGYKRMVGGFDAGGFLLQTNALAPQSLHVPLDFWFNINAGLSLPLIALQYHEVRFIFHFLPVKDCIVLIDNLNGEHIPTDDYDLNPTDIQNLKCQIDFFIDYIYLDTDERRRFAQMSHEYLIEQVQYQSQTTGTPTSGIQNLRLNFNHPCKELMFFFTRSDNWDNNDYFNFSTATAGLEVVGGDVMKNAIIKLNGHNRFTPERGPLFFRQWQPFIHHTNIPNSHLYVYSFALRPEEHQPSGTCNFSRIDTTMLYYTLEIANLQVNAEKKLPSPVIEKYWHDPSSYYLTCYARNYNVLRIMSGMGGLAYSN